MTTRQFKANSAWGPRNDSAAEIGQRMLRCLDALQKLSPLFHSWWLNDVKKGTGIPLETARLNMTKIVRLGLMGEESAREKYDTHQGYLVIALNEPKKCRQSAKLMIQDGVGEKLHIFHGIEYLNSASFGTGWGTVPDPALISYPIFKSVILTLAPILGAAYTQAFPSDLRDYTVPERPLFDLSWMTYLAAPLARKITPPDGLVAERTPDGGLLLIAAEETFDVSNPQHRAGALAIREALTPLNRAAEQYKAAHPFGANMM